MEKSTRKFPHRSADTCHIMSRPQDYSEDEAPRSVSRGGSKVKSERVALLVLSALLAAAVIVIWRLSFANLRIEQSFQALRDEHEAVKRNLTVPQPCTETPGEINDVHSTCEEGWEQHGGNCYYFSNVSSTWEESRAACIQQGAALVKIDSREEQNFLEKKLRVKMNFLEDKFWIGLTDSQEEKKWLWSDSSPLNESLTFWSAGEPDNWDGKDPDGEDCVRMGERGEAEDLKCWFDKSCKVPHRSICERKSTKTGHI